MKKQGYSARDTLSGTNLSETGLSDPVQLIDIPRYIQVVSNMMALTRSPCLAFDLGTELLMGDLGVLGYAVMSSQDMAQAHPIWLKYNSLFFGNLIRMTESAPGNGNQYEYVPQVKLQPHLLRFFMEEKIIIETRLFHEFIGLTPVAKVLKLNYPRPRHWSRYEEALKAKVLFNQDKILCNMNLKSIHHCCVFEGANTEMHRLCINYLENMANVINSSTSFSAKVAMILKQSLPSLHSARQLSEHLGMNERTLERKLAKENTTFNNILREVRENLSKTLIVTTDMTSYDISRHLGFSNPNSFSRAFKVWTGSTVSSYRNSLQRKYHQYKTD